MDALRSWPGRVLALLLTLQAAAYYAVASRSEIIPEILPLTTLPASSGQWTAVREFPIEKETQDVLRADDTLSREYVHGANSQHAGLFIAFFKTQRFGQAPHSPKNCLPGSGWEPAEDSKLPVSVPGQDMPIVVNKYVVARGENKTVVLYWYQSHGHVIASEFAAKFQLVADAVRYRRSDTALVRVMVPVQDSVEAAEKTAVVFTQAVYPDIAARLPQ
jgi:EpsI family protein